MIKRLVFIAVLAALVSIVFLLPERRHETKDERPLVIATINPYYLMARQIAGDKLQIEVLYPPKSSPHHYAPTPDDVLRLERARLIIANGFNYEANLSAALESRFKEKLLLASASMQKDTLIYFSGHHHDESEQKSGEHREDGQLTPNPHIWLDADCLKKVAGAICLKFSEMDKNNSEFYRQNLKIMLEELEAVDKKILSERGGFKAANIITFHDGFPYFTKRYNINLVDMIEPSPGQKPAPDEFVELGRKIQKHGVKALFIEPQLNPQSADALAKEFKLNVYTLDYLGAFFDAKNVSDILIKNWDVMKQGFEK